MTQSAALKKTENQFGFKKLDPASPALVVTGKASISIKAGTSFSNGIFEQDTPVNIGGDLEAGTDYIVIVDEEGAPLIDKATAENVSEALGGFHFAPGGNATARKGGDETPAINPYSVWDQSFRPASPDPRGMALVEMPNGKKFWCDIYLLGVTHMTDGTSKFGAKIADGDDTPQNTNGDGDFDKLDYATAVEVMTAHGKQLPSFEEFAAAAFGVTEKTACRGDAETTKLDAPRTSKFGIQQATGVMWVWGHCGDPEEPRASIFGGSWYYGGNAGSRRANVACWSPDNSNDGIGARGRSDHLQRA